MSKMSRCNEAIGETLNDNRDEAMVAVQDTGKGIDPQESERNFDAIVTTKKGGLRLGLSIRRTIIEAHVGKLWATPKEGKAQPYNSRFRRPANESSKF